MPEIRILKRYCKGCGLCIDVCPKHALELSDEIDRRGVHVVKFKADVECSGCGNCAVMCPDAAIEIIETVEK